MVKLDAMENPYPLPDGAAARARASGWRASALNRYPEPSRARRCASCIARKHDACRRAWTHARQRLGRADPDRRHGAARAPGAAMLSRRRPSSCTAWRRASRGMKFVGVPLRDRLRARRRRDPRAHRASSPALVYLAYPNNPTGKLYPRRRRASTHHRGRARASSWSTRPTSRSPARRFMDRAARAIRTCVVMRTVSKLGLAGMRLGYLSAGRAGSPSSTRCARPTTSAC